MNINFQNVVLDRVAGSSDRHLKSGPFQIAFSGRSNVGKSTLINSLLSRKKIARVSGTPGKTVTVNYYLIDKKIYFVDLPGYGYARGSKTDIARWSAVTEDYFKENAALKLIVQLIDSRQGPTKDDADMLGFMNHYGIPYTVVFTKTDKLKGASLQSLAEDAKKSPLIRRGTDIILYSAVKGQGKNELLSKILSVV